MATFFDTIKTRFDADSQLSTDGFSELFQGHAKRGEDNPFCVLKVSEDEKIRDGFKVRFHSGVFTFVIEGASQELCKTYRDHVVDVFKDIEAQLSVTGISVFLLEERATRYSEIEEGLWWCVIDYQYGYSEAR